MSTYIELKPFFNQKISKLSVIYEPQEAQSVAYIWLKERLGIEKTDVLLNKNITISDRLLALLEDDFNKLKHFTPIQYVLKKAFFLEMPFYVDDSVLIPRPETEELVYKILNLHENEALKVLDIGTGSGCIPIVLKSQRPYWDIAGWDISAKAIEVANKNAIDHKVQVSFENIDMTIDNGDVHTKKHLIISNPPYIQPHEKVHMENRVKNYEPEMALYAPENDPFFYYRHILLWAKKLLLPGGYVYLEINALLAKEMMHWLQNENWALWRLEKDMFNKDRFIIGEKILV